MEVQGRDRCDFQGNPVCSASRSVMYAWGKGKGEGFSPLYSHSLSSSCTCIMREYHIKCQLRMRGYSKPNKAFIIISYDKDKTTLTSPILPRYHVSAVRAGYLSAWLSPASRGWRIDSCPRIGERGRPLLPPARLEWHVIASGVLSPHR